MQIKVALVVIELLDIISGQAKERENNIHRDAFFHFRQKNSAELS